MVDCGKCKQAKYLHEKINDFASLFNFEGKGSSMTFYKVDFTDYSKVNTRHYLIDQYLDFKNNYLSPDLFAEHRGIDVEQAKALIDIGRDLFNTKHPEA
jgi:hypothetical protein